MKQTEFRAWLQNKWIEYKREVFDFDGVVVDTKPSEYFQRYKWFLKSLYKEEKRGK